ncbi:MAG: vWA domain-containing protein [Myxococcaceae bacterium]|nr:vWA domain-containing protein [Myxococcaceae bacterium]
MRLQTLLSVVLLVLACGRTDPLRYDPPPLPLPEPMPVDAGLDAGLDAGVDAGFDAGVDAGVDAGLDGGTDAGKPCLDGRFTLAPAVPVVVLVLDRSGSMDDAFPGATSKWDALVRSLNQALPAVNQTMELGLLLYPLNRALACTSAAQASPLPGLGNVPTILQTLAMARPAGGTPTADAISAGVASLQGRRTATSARALVLATDGVPNCNGLLFPRTCLCLMPPCSAEECVDDVRTVQRVRDAFTAGIPTYVIGIESPNAAFTGVLDQLAVAGGRARSNGRQKYYSAESAADLQTALTTIRDQVGQCTFLTSSVPNADGGLRVLFRGREVPFDMNEGWSWTDRDNGELVFRGASCQQVMGQAQALEVVVACSP